LTQYFSRAKYKSNKAGVRVVATDDSLLKTQVRILKQNFSRETRKTKTSHENTFNFHYLF